MPSIPFDFGFYAILTNPAAGYEKLTAICVNLEVPLIQLRMKDALETDVAKTALAMKRITDGSSSRLIINDYPHIALDTGADGIHLGQTDMPYNEARKIMGPSAIIGLSTHNPNQTKEACLQSPDYIGVGPVYPTPTKKIADPPIGISGMKVMLNIATVPAVVLGAISLENLPSIIAAGAKNFCMVRPVNSSLDPESVIRKILDVTRQNKENS